MASTTLKVALCAVFASLPGFVASQDTGSEPPSQPAEPAKPDDAESCFDVTRTKDFNVLSDQHAYVKTYGGNQYLLTMGRVCENLRRSYVSRDVRIEPYGRRVCPNDGSHLVYSGFGREQVCPIFAITRVESRADARLLAQGERAPIEIEEVTLPDSEE